MHRERRKSSLKLKKIIIPPPSLFIPLNPGPSIPKRETTGVSALFNTHAMTFNIHDSGREKKITAVSG